MDNETLPEKSWWQKNWKWLLPLCLFLLFCIVIINAVVNVRNRESEKGIAFNKSQWEMKNNADYPNRNKMLKELMTSDTLKQLKKEEVIQVLGQPDRMDNAYLFYTIAQERLGLFPLHTKTLVIKINDSTANSVMIHQ